MSLRTDMLALKDELIGLRLPSELDQGVHQLTIRVRTWSGGARDVGGATDQDLVLPRKYTVRQLTTREVDASGGRFRMGDVLVKGIVPADPANPGIGYYPSQLAPAIVQGQEQLYLLAGPLGGEYGLGELRSDKVYGYDLVLVRRLTTPEIVGPFDAAGGAHE